jgi:TrpR family trp operon transcriptional repressor
VTERKTEITLYKAFLSVVIFVKNQMFLSRETEGYLMQDLHELIQVFARVNNYDEMQRLFEELFTMKEKYDFALRWRLMKDISRGVPQREIAQNLGISLCKITRGSKILKKEDSLMKKLIEEQNNVND